MEERLDDAINVLRNHAEVGLAQLPPNLGPQMTSLNYAAPPSDAHLNDSIKVERATYNTSKYNLKKIDAAHVKCREDNKIVMPSRPLGKNPR